MAAVVAAACEIAACEMLDGTKVAPRALMSFAEIFGYYLSPREGAVKWCGDAQ